MSDRYQFLTDYNDPHNESKTFFAGSTARLDDATGAALIASGTVKRVADHTPQRRNALAPGGCTELSPEAKEILNVDDANKGENLTNKKKLSHANDRDS